MAVDEALAGRVREVLAGSPVREVRMFGGLAFMVDGRMAVSVGRDGELLVRTDPDEEAALLAEPGARPAEMAGRVMGGGWITVAGDAVADVDGVRSWVGVALRYAARS